MEATELPGVLNDQEHLTIVRNFLHLILDK